MKTRTWRIVAIILAAAVFVVAWALIDVPPLSVLREWATTTGAWFPVVFWLLYVLITQFPIPRTVMTLSSGILFGPVWGIIISLTATTVAAALSLVIVRGLLRDWIEPRLTHPTVATINDHLERRGWLAVVSLRLIAGVPFSIMNYVAALTKVRLVPFTLATLVGSAPGTILITLFGDTLTGEANPAVIATMAVLALVGIAGLIVDTRRARRDNAQPDDLNVKPSQ
ncbi:TVP38/TMEM64 family protein [Corynebacterium pilosum]|uniref:TVP38/TMEM64 family membrane protein n=1 Tax=Corynebacterium pilosum TaxID=35756 RepID=A0A376CPL4_9CORY|nr:TVP38/TMEM64 family protein [Corynebacterium pilosum]STC70466.1 TVP38/TMEM64 family inner membrane protein ydjZ [Corynebacterium pilosum]